MSATASVATAEMISEADLAANRQLDRRFTMAIAHQDVDEIMSCFWNSLDATLVVYDGTVYRGWQTIRAMVKQLCDAHEKLQLTVDEVTHFRVGDCVLAVGTATWRMKPKGAPETSFTERWTDVRRRVAGEWVYALDHAHAVTK